MNLKKFGTEYRQKLAKVISAAKGVITPRLVCEVLHVSSQEAGRILTRWNKRGWVKRVKRGVYVPVAIEDITGEMAVENTLVLADRLFGPGYIGGFSAIKHWDLSEQILETITFFTKKQVKDHDPIIGGVRLHLKTVAGYKIFGTKTIWFDNVKIAVSDPTKTIVDILDDPSLVGGMRIVKDIFLEYQDSEFFNLDLLIAYARRLGNKTVLKRLGFLLEIMGFKNEIEKYKLSANLSKGYSTFDPCVENPCIVRKWGLRVSKIWKQEYDRKK